MIPYLVDANYNIADLLDNASKNLVDVNGNRLRIKTNNSPVYGKTAGYLTEATDCFAESEANGGHELVFRYPVSGVNYNKLALGNIVMADNCPSDIAGTKTQPYRIYRITRPINGIVKVYARHIVQTDLSAAVLLPSKYTNAQNAVDGLTLNAIAPHDFTITSEVYADGEMILSSPTSVLSAMMGNDNSILSIYGGEWVFDGQSATLKERAGADSGCNIVYGINLRTFEQDANIAKCYTGAVGYYTRGDDPAFYTPIISTASEFTHNKIAAIDFSSAFENPPTVSKLISETKKYIRRNGFGIPDVSIKLSYIDLASTTEFIGKPKHLQLWDDVHISFPKLSIDTIARVTKTKYNVLLDRYEVIEVGSSKRSLADNLAKQQYDISQSASKKEAAAIARYVSNSYVIEQEEQ